VLSGNLERVLLFADFEVSFAALQMDESAFFSFFPVILFQSLRFTTEHHAFFSRVGITPSKTQNMNNPTTPALAGVKRMIPIHPLWLAALLALCAFFTPFAKAADVNVLVIGCEKNYRSYKAYSGANVVTEFRKILEGAGLGTVNVVYEDRKYQYDASGSYLYETDLYQWFYGPYPADVERTVRWPNLRGEAGTPWDYVVLIGDGYSIERFPGYYAAGVASVAGEVAKGTAKPILLMTWPYADSYVDYTGTYPTSVAHYEEVTYRVGNSGGYKVAPAGLAWQAAGSSKTADQHPNNDGAYIAAATLFSTIWNKSATNSTYNPKPTLAQTAYNTFTNSLVTPHYTGKYNLTSTNVHGFYDSHPRRILCDGIDSSSENGVKGGFGRAMLLAGCTISGLLDTTVVNTQRYTYSGGGTRIVYGFSRHEPSTVSGGQDEYCRSISSDVSAMQSSQNNNISNNTDVARWLPLRMIYARIAQRYPASRPWEAGHIAGHLNEGMGSFGVTQLGGGGRSPIKPPEQVKNEYDYCYQAGYELAWQFRHLQVRAPGLRFIPDSLTVGFTTPEVIRVKFYYKPKSNVTVTVTSAGPVQLENATLTFTPENYNVEQEVRVLATGGAVRGSTFEVGCITSSDDDVYDGIHDAWPYMVNRLPTTQNIDLDVLSGNLTPITLKGYDPDGEPLTYQIVDPPQYGTVTVNGPVASYTSNAGYTGSDSFTYKCNDSGDDSNVATVEITVTPKTPYNFNLIRNPSAELEPLSAYGWVGDWSRTLGGTEGSYHFTGGVSLYQNIDISRYAERIARGDQYFSFSADLYCNGYVDRVGFKVDCLDATGKIVQTNSVAQYNSFAYQTYSGALLAPTNTASIRVTIWGWTSNGGGARVRADRLNLTALTPQNIAPVAYDQTGLVASAGIPNPVTLTASDIDKDDLVYIIVTPPSHGTISGGVGAARFYTPDAGYEGPDSLTFRVFDREFNSNDATVSFDVVRNQLPTIVLDSPRTSPTQVPENVDLLLRTTVWDDGLPNALQCAWSMVSGPAGANVSFTNPSEPDTGVQMNNVGGDYVFRLTVTDGAVTVTQDVAVTVGYDPARNIGAFIFRQESYEGTPGVPFVMSGAYASDDGKPIEPGEITYEFLKVAGTGNAVFADATVSEPTVTFDRAGSYVVRMIANDGEVEVYNDIPVTISSTENLAPVAEAVLLSPALPKAGDTITLSGAGSFDPNLDPLTFSWVQTGGTGVTLSAGDVMEPTFVASDLGDYTFDLTVSDGLFSNTTSVVVSVLNAPPVVDAGVQQTVYRVPGTLLWTPAHLGMAAWYDASDKDMIVERKGIVSQWSDKSGSDRHMVQGTAGVQPTTGTRTINGLNAIEFDGINDVMTGAKNHTDAITIFGVVLADSGANTDANRCWLSAPGGTNPDYHMMAPANADTLGAQMLDSTGSGSPASRPAVRNIAHIIGAYSWVPGGTAGGVRVDGGTTASLAAKATGLQMKATELAIGRQKPGFTTRFYDGLVGEVLIINRRLAATDDDFLKIEGYLAHKWNLAANLPADHPYRNVPPMMSANTAVVSLDGTVSDPDPEDTVTTEWSVTGGNHRTVFFGDAGAVDTTATFTQDGTFVLRLTADDGDSSVYDEVTITVKDGVPVARAGEDQTIVDSDNNGSEDITLNGSASSSPIGTITSHVWETGGTQIATGATPTVSLPVGIHEITLTVTDGDGISASDIVTITVLRFNNAPIVNAGPNQAVVISEVSGPLFTPSDLTGVGAWYDASDTGTITTVTGSKVSEWRTKAGSTRTLVQATDANRPLYVGNSYIEFDGVNDLLSATGFDSTPNITVFTVSMSYTNASVADGNKSLMMNWNGSDSNPDWWLINRTDSDTQGAHTSYSGSNVGSSLPAARDVAHLRAFTSYTSALNGLHRLNGGSESAAIATAGSVMQNGTGRTLTVGRQKNTSTRFFQGRVHEIIIVPSRLLPTDSDGNYLKIEGYLAHKWGTTASLPSGHPYKNTAPTQEAVPSATATLAGSASDADNDPLTTTWSVISTPAGGSATFDDASALDTTATFTALGEYVLRLTADDGFVSAYDEVTITVTDGTTGLDAFNDWIADGGGGGGVTFTGDSNSDGLADGMAWLLGSENATHSANGLLPQQSAEPNGDLTISFKMLNSSKRGTAVLRLEHSRDLGVTDPWSENIITVPDTSGTVEGVVFTITPIDGTDHNQVTATLPSAAASGTGKLFVRLNGVLSP
jgi:hypothetical protein